MYVVCILPIPKQTCNAHPYTCIDIGNIGFCAYMGGMHEGIYSQAIGTVCYMRNTCHNVQGKQVRKLLYWKY